MSDQMVAAISLTLLQSLMNQTDIVPVLKGFDVVLDGEELKVANTPKAVDLQVPEFATVDTFAVETV